VDEELELGLRSIAVPVLTGGNVEVAINVSVSAAQMSVQEMREQLLPVLLSAVKSVG
jgi:IclR family transcriptional regulator, pca regulon regulatory protein